MLACVYDFTVISRLVKHTTNKDTNAAINTILANKSIKINALGWHFTCNPSICCSLGGKGCTFSKII